jgi:hypothetical protein
VLLARPLDAGELAEVSEHLEGRLLELFLAQQVADQRHGLEAFRHVASVKPDDTELLRAAALHDVGKAHSRLGPIARSIATVLMFARLPMTRRMKMYARHGVLGADDLEAAGASELVVGFARYHQQGRPEWYPEEEWAVLRGADLNL